MRSDGVEITTSIKAAKPETDTRFDTPVGGRILRRMKTNAAYHDQTQNVSLKVIWAEL